MEVWLLGGGGREGQVVAREGGWRRGEGVTHQMSRLFSRQSGCEADDSSS